MKEKNAATNKKKKEKKELKSYQGARVWYICKKIILKKLAKGKYYWKVRDYCYYAGKYRVAARNILSSKINVPNEIFVFFIMV